ncbi:enoyl-CoA hydratase-related protein [Sphingobium sp. JS3065]|uniref:enoyl-CoA hydratase-related protein n=1 Tax=Sphingobium sp. JS3065 TaxID=2970925 RepID=UPI002263F4DF|nr:enoyl-CoA hydratase-related protein [Sphingobium sp. JS3065]UZW56399.1 enoyl-CoA hydratase-related protein [Sphingobium sp. JS3065]
MLMVNDVTSYDVDRGVAMIVVDSPPVNALGAIVRKGLAEALARASDDEAVLAVVIMCAGRTFFAGADISEIGKPMAEPTLRDLQVILEGMTKLVVAAIHGSALGGGLELAMAADYRVAAHSARCGLPEVNLGLLPGAGGTQRLPRLVGISNALDLMLAGEPIAAAAAMEMGLIDRLVEDGALGEGAVAFARTVAHEKASVIKTRDRTDRMPSSPEQKTQARKLIEMLRQRHDGYKAKQNIISAVEKTIDLSFAEGVAAEAILFEELKTSPQSAALRYVFFAERQAAKPPETGAGATRGIDKVAVPAVGPSAETLVREGEAAGIVIESAGKIADAGLTFENMPSLMADHDRIRAIVGNGSDPAYLEICLGTDPRRSILFEIVQTDRSSIQDIGSLFRFGKDIGRLCVLSHGATSICDRLAFARDRQIEQLLSEGHALPRIVCGLRGFGFSIPLGPEVEGDERDEARSEQEFAPDLLERVILAIVNEAAHVLQEGAARTASDIDVVAVMGLGWPRYEGGPLYWADSQGLPSIRARLEALGKDHGDAFKPARILSQDVLVQR